MKILNVRNFERLDSACVEIPPLYALLAWPYPRVSYDSCYSRRNVRYLRILLRVYNIIATISILFEI